MSLEEYQFNCPNCDHDLVETGKLYFVTQRQNGDVGKIYLSIKFGSYSYVHVPKAEFALNELVLFFCPSCNSSLTDNVYTNFIKLKMLVEKKFEFEILFSRKAGEHKTYIITEDGIERYGEHVDDEVS